jgi:hypothetical protein
LTNCFLIFVNVHKNKQYSLFCLISSSFSSNVLRGAQNVPPFSRSEKESH